MGLFGRRHERRSLEALSEQRFPGDVAPEPDRPPPPEGPGRSPRAPILAGGAALAAVGIAMTLVGPAADVAPGPSKSPDVVRIRSPRVVASGPGVDVRLDRVEQRGDSLTLDVTLLGGLEARHVASVSGEVVASNRGVAPLSNVHIERRGEGLRLRSFDLPWSDAPVVAVRILHIEFEIPARAKFDVDLSRVWPPRSTPVTIAPEITHEVGGAPLTLSGVTGREAGLEVVFRRPEHPDVRFEGVHLDMADGRIAPHMVGYFEGGAKVVFEPPRGAPAPAGVVILGVRVVWSLLWSWTVT